MAFQREVTRTPIAIGDISVELFDADTTGNEQDGAHYSVQVKFDDGSIVVRTGNLIPHITQTQINQLLAFMAMLRTKAINEFLP